MSDASQDEGRFMVAVGAVIEHVPTGRILMMQRAATADFMPGMWEDLTGRMKQFEEPEDALRREIREETGLEIEVVKPIKIFHLYRGERTAQNELVGIVYWCTAESDRVTLSHEHDAYRWVLPREALEMVDDPGIRDDIEAFIAERGRER
jgi:8-oxo-dGTP diphosphatase